jgi:hypothetical protein
MRPGTFNVIYITLDGFALLGHFCKAFEVLTDAGNRRQVVFNGP